LPFYTLLLASQGTYLEEGLSLSPKSFPLKVERATPEREGLFSLYKTLPPKSGVDNTGEPERSFAPSLKSFPLRVERAAPESRRGASLLLQNSSL